LNWPLLGKLILYMSLFLTAAVTAYLWIMSGWVGDRISRDELQFMAWATFVAALGGGGIWIVLTTCFVELWGKRRWLYPVAASLATFGMTALLDGPISLPAWIFGIFIGVVSGFGWWRMVSRAERHGEQIV
jgi:hypothetical protein